MKTDRPKLQNKLPVSLSANSWRRIEDGKTVKQPVFPLNVRKCSLETGMEPWAFEGCLAFLLFSKKKHFHWKVCRRTYIYRLFIVCFGKPFFPEKLGWYPGWLGKYHRRGGWLARSGRFCWHPTPVCNPATSHCEMSRWQGTVMFSHTWLFLCLVCK